MTVKGSSSPCSARANRLRRPLRFRLGLRVAPGEPLTATPPLASPAGILRIMRKALSEAAMKALNLVAGIEKAGV